MKYEANILFQNILQGKLFLENNYIICVGSNFPYWFFLLLQQYLEQHGHIATGRIATYEEIIHNDQKVIVGLFDEAIPLFSKKNLFFVSLSRETLQIKKNFFSFLKKKNDYYIIFVRSIDYYLLMDESSYNLDTIFTGIKKIYLKDFYRVILHNENNSTMNYFFNFIYDDFGDYMTVDFFFSLLPFINLMNKKHLQAFMIHYISFAKKNLLFYSLFDLVTFFLQNKSTQFFVAWEQYKRLYPIEFWLYFWIEQIMYVILYILSKENKIEDNPIIKKKVNRWFLKYGYSSISVTKLQSILLQFFKIDSLFKKYQTIPMIHLDSFFIYYFFNSTQSCK